MKQPLCFCVAVLLAGCSLATAQTDAQNTERATPTATVPLAPSDQAEGLIKLDLLVTDAKGASVAGLKSANFNLFEAGRQQKILSFDAFDGGPSGSEPPVKIILLIDTIELPENLAREERVAVITYLHHSGSRLEHPTSVFMLADSGLYTIAPSRDGNVLAHEIEHNDFTFVRHNVGWQRGPEPRGLKDTNSDSASKALGLIATEERKRPGRKLLLWVGPGWDIGSGAYADAAQGSKKPFDAVWWFSTLLREARIVLYSFAVGETSPRAQLYKAYLDGVKNPHEASFMNVYRKVLAIQSGGRVMEDSQDVLQQIESCVGEAGPYYRISFDPFAADHLNEYHDLKVVVNQPGLIAHTNTGYYDQPYYSIDLIPPARPVSIEQLQQLLTASRGESDADLAKKLSELQLTERLSEHRLSLLITDAIGKRSRQELHILADLSAFQSPPADEILDDAPPDSDSQRRMLSDLSAYLNTTIHKLPDFFARRTTVRYQETSMYLDDARYQPLHVTDNSTTTIRYHNGSEIAETKPPKRKPNSPELITYGVFGPALEGALSSIEKSSELTWSRWEQGPDGRVAVFHSKVPSERSLREVLLCCLPDGDGKEAFQRRAGYREEITVDPQSGAVLRLAYQADLKSNTPLARDEIMVEYGPVEIGGKAYICPLRSVSIIRGRSVRIPSLWDEAFMTYGPYTTMLNDIRFDQYHIFRSESQVLTDIPPGPQ